MLLLSETARVSHSIKMSASSVLGERQRHKPHKQCKINYCCCERANIRCATQCLCQGLDDSFTSERVSCVHVHNELYYCATFALYRVDDLDDFRRRCLQKRYNYKFSIKVTHVLNDFIVRSHSGHNENSWRSDGGRGKRYIPSIAANFDVIW